MRLSFPLIPLQCMGFFMGLWGLFFTMNAQVRPLDHSSYRLHRQALTWQDSLRQAAHHLPLTAAEEAFNQQWVTLRRSMTQQYKQAHFFPPARPFYKSQSHIESTALFQWIRNMPKGGLLHLHPSAGVDPLWLLQTAREMPEIHVYWGPDTPQYLRGQLRCFAEGKAPEGFVPYQQLQKRHIGIQDSLLALLTFDLSIYEDSVNIWGEFEKRFRRLGGMSRYRPIYGRWMESVLDTLATDGISHVDLRVGLAGGLYDLEHPFGYYNADTMMLDLHHAWQRVRQRWPDFTYTVIYTNLRAMSQKQMYGDLVQAFQLRKKYPDLIRGYDLVGQEDGGHTTRYFIEQWLKKDSLEQVFGIDMPLYLHDGESTWPDVDNLYDAVLLNSERIGHGFNLFRFPRLMEMAAERDICLEVNPWSNQILGFIQDLRLHPASYYLSQGVPITLNCDDPLIFGNKGLSYDFWAATMAWELDIRDVKQLIINSITYSSLPESAKRKAYLDWERSWYRYVNEMVDE